MAGDRLLAIDGYEIRDEKFLTARLRERERGQSITLHLFRYGLLMERSIMLGEAMPESVTLRPIENPSPLQRRIYESWLERA
jgi:predicted metalloprotease with PDZ domain